jgi:O-antigen ligase
MSRSSGFLSSGFLQWAFVAMLGLVGFTVLMSGRDLSQLLTDLDGGTTSLGTLHPAVLLAQRVVSILVVVTALERLASHVVLRKHFPSPVLAWAFVTYWLGTVAAPALLGSHPQLGHEYLYTLAIGLAAAVAGPQEHGKVLDASRDALFVFLLAGVALIPVMPALVLDLSYSQGLLPGVPRLGGLAPHPVALGMIAQIFLLCLWCRPFRHRWLNWLAWVVGTGVLFLAQSKTAWIAFLLCSATLLLVRNGGSLWRRAGDPRQSAFGILLCVLVALFALAGMGFLLLGDIGSQASRFFDSAEGAQLLSMTGRDRIWAIALEEWHSSPLFGYGPGLWDADYRASIGMPNATSAHNQFMDTLARSGAVGATALVIYAGVLLVLSIRYAKATGGFSLALFLALALRSISEVPLLLLGYGTELFSHLLLIVTLAAAAAGARTQTAPAARAHSIYGAAS